MPKWWESSVRPGSRCSCTSNCPGGGGAVYISGTALGKELQRGHQWDSGQLPSRRKMTHILPSFL